MACLSAPIRWMRTRVWDPVARSTQEVSTIRVRTPAGGEWYETCSTYSWNKQRSSSGDSAATTHREVVRSYILTHPGSEIAFTEVG